MANQDIHTRAMLVSLSISSWTARKYDRKTSQEVADQHGATLDAGRYNKHLLPADAPTYKALNSHIAAMRITHYEQTLPWSDEGWRLLSVKNYQPYMSKMRNGKHIFDGLLEEFLSDYPSLCVEAQRRFNGLFDSDDYPTNIRTRYGWDIDVKPVPTSDFRVQLSDEEIQILAANVEARNRSAWQDAQNDAVQRLYDCLAKMHERLAQPNAVFRDSLIGNARDVCDVLQRINLNDDVRLEEMRRQTELLAMTEPQTLRDNADVRIDTANRVQSILEQMNATYGGMFK